VVVARLVRAQIERASLAFPRPSARKGLASEPKEEAKAIRAFAERCLAALDSAILGGWSLDVRFRQT
jgi:hypothetical protein